jgi:TolA-binding protein
MLVSAQMAEKLGVLNQWLFGEWADRAAINRNAEELSTVEADLSALRTTVQRQAEEILRLRAMFMGVVEVLREKAPFDHAELEHAVQTAWTKLTTPAAKPPPPKAQMTDPYRGTPSEPTAADIAAAKALLAEAQKHHFSKQFREARALYHQVVDQYTETKEAGIARQQLKNLSNA